MTGRALPKSQLWDIIKSKIRVKITRFETIEEADKPSSHKVIDTIYTTMSGKEFRRSMEQDYLDGEENRVELVEEEPATFRFNCVYIRKDGKVAWIYCK